MPATPRSVGILKVEADEVGRVSRDQCAAGVGAPDEAHAPIRIPELEVDDRVARLVELGHEDRLEASAAAERRHGNELVRLVQHRATVADRADPHLRAAGCEWRVHEERAAAALGVGLSLGQARFPPLVRELPGCTGAEEGPRVLELSDAGQLDRRGQPRRLGVIDDRSARL